MLYNDLSAHYRGAELAQMQTTYAAMFHAGWFVESMWSQTLVIHMIRTPKLPFIQSLGPGDVADLYRHRGTDGHPLYRIGKNARICRPPRSLFCLPDPLHFVVYGVGDQY